MPVTEKVNRLNSRIVLLERQRDELQRANFALRDKLLEYAKECLGCDGTGVKTYPHEHGGKDAVLPCDECADIRELLS